jgi:predicted lipoprotein with Yx(FWY)xxD motif
VPHSPGESRARNEWLRNRTKFLNPMSRLLAIAGILVSLALTACGGDDGSTTTRSAQGAGDGSAAADRKSSGRAQNEAGSGTKVVVADSQYGPVLFDSTQQAIYLFDRETSDASRCYGACAEAWPPVLTDGEPVGGDGVATELLGTTQRDDGSTQVTYDGHPLYYYVHDPPGELLCHGVDEFGGLWLAVDPTGKAVQ